MKQIDINEIPKTPAERREYIKRQLHARGWTLCGLSRAHGVSRSVAQVALRDPLPKWERIIADVLGVEPQQLWPERYDEHGRPNRPRGRTLAQRRVVKRSHHKQPGRRNVQKGRAA